MAVVRIMFRIEFLTGMAKAGCTGLTIGLFLQSKHSRHPTLYFLLKQ
jgi:hypothetical protein